ncbi:MAG: hypothetical protein WBH85_06415 [Thermoanaerobaculia bacterium]
MRLSASSLLKQLDELRHRYGTDAAPRRLEILRELGGRPVGQVEEVFRLHELLCFLRAYPDDQQVLEQVEIMLEGFSARSDLRRFRQRLADTGLAGTDINYRFYWVTAGWLAHHWPDHLSIDWPELHKREELLGILDLLMPYSETPALDQVDYSVREWVERLKGPDETDAAFLIRRFAALEVTAPVRERIYEQLDIPLTLTPGPGTPTRTLAKYRSKASTAFQTRSLRRERPDLKHEVSRRPVAVRELSIREGGRLIDLAREAMTTRQRDLDAFANADPRDVRLVELGGGLGFACYGLLPERRLLLECSYGMIMLKNDVPFGYALASTLFRSTEVAYNIFDTFRGGEAGWIFGRLLATIHHLFGTEVFAIDPFQLGLGNKEGLASGAWWFYYKLGFRPRDREIRRLLRGELEQMKIDPGHRSSPATLEQLAADYVFFYLGRQRDDVLGRVFLGNIGLEISHCLAQRFGGERERGLAVCSREAMHLLGLRTLEGFSPGERLAWERWSPLVLILPGVDRWSTADRRALVRVVRAKGGRRESDFLRRFDRHPRLGKALLQLAS